MHNNTTDLMFSEVGTAEKLFKRHRLIVHSAATWNNVLEVGTAEKIKNIQVAQWWCILPQFETM